MVFTEYMNENVLFAIKYKVCVTRLHNITAIFAHVILRIGLGFLSNENPSKLNYIELKTIDKVKKINHPSRSEWLIPTCVVAELDYEKNIDEKFQSVEWRVKHSTMLIL